MRSDHDDENEGFRWGREAVGGLLGFVGALVFVKVGESPFPVTVVAR